MELWAGLAELRGNPNCKNFHRFGKNKGAFVWVTAWAESQAAFETKVKVMAETLDCILYGLEEVGLLDAKMEADNYPEEFINMRATATRQRKDTVLGDFTPTNGTTTSDRQVVPAQSRSTFCAG